MAKHLARSEKRPLKAEKQNIRRERRARESDAGERGLAILSSIENARWLPVILPVLLLIAAALLPLEGWMRPAAYAVPALSAFAPILLASVSSVREKQFSLQRNPYACRRYPALCLRPVSRSLSCWRSCSAAPG